MNIRAAYITAFLFLLALGNPGAACAQVTASSELDDFNKLLAAGNMASALESTGARLQANPDDDEARFRLGILQFLHAVEVMGQSFSRYGPLAPRGLLLPFVRVAGSSNRGVAPEPITQEDFRAILLKFGEDLEVAESTLKAIEKHDIKIPFHLGNATIDLDGNGSATEDEKLWRLYTKLNPGSRINEQSAPALLLNLDEGDVYWLRGYCHFLGAMIDWYLAYDDTELFDRTAHLFFANPSTSSALLRDKVAESDFEFGNIVDAVAFIHLINFPIKDKARSESALHHLQETIDLSRKSWDCYGSETDDDHEWIPAPGQTPLLEGWEVNLEMVTQWRAFLDEMDSLLAGEKLAPFWRGTGTKGVNLHRVFTEPRPFDLVLWVQGSAALPYLEDGEMTDPKFWDRLLSSFNGRFIGFALWFN